MMSLSQAKWMLVACCVCGLLGIAACKKDSAGKSAGDSTSAKGAAASEAPAFDYVAGARAFVDKAMNEADSAYLMEHVSPDYVDHTPIPGQEPGPGGFLKVLKTLKTAMPDLKITLEDAVLSGNKLAMRLHVEGTHTGPLGAQAPTNKKISVMSYDQVTLSEGKVMEHWGVFDTFGMLNQLGKGPSVEQILTGK